MKALFCLSAIVLLSCANATLKGGKGKKDKGTQGFEAPIAVTAHVVPETGCKTVYDDVWVEKCGTVYKDACDIQTTPSCRTVHARECSPKNEEQCSFVMEQKCTRHPIPYCNVVWQKQCVKEPVCTTFDDEVCETVDKQVCVTHLDKQCTHVHKKVCIKVAVPVPTIPKTYPVVVETQTKSKGDKGKGSKGGKHKRSLEKILGKLEKKAAHINEKREKVIAHYASKGKGKGETVVHTTPVVHAAPSIHVEYREECHDKPEEKCIDVPREACHVEPEQRCKWVPRETCVEKEKCTNLPKKDCGFKEKETCVPFPSRKCKTVTREVCVSVPRQECRDVAHEVCHSIPEKACQKVTVKHPREVCVPPPRTTLVKEAW